MKIAVSFALALTALTLACTPRDARDRPAPTTAPAAVRPTTIATPATPPANAGEAFPARFADVTDAAGIRFVHESGAYGAKFLPETMGSGVALFDADGDTRLDIYFPNFLPWPSHEKGVLPTGALYRNLGDFRFEDVTARSGLAVPMRALGATTADIEGDGDADLFVTTLGADHLFRNDGGIFTDITGEVGIADDDFGTASTWLDVERDGDLDLFVGNYVKWTVASDLHCTLDGVTKSYCTPESYEGASPRLWLNDGHGRFTDGTDAAGLRKPTAKSLGVVAVDHDGDTWQDLIVANDTQPNYVFRNVGGGKFAEEGVISGVAFSETGMARGAMGIDAGDIDGSGRPSLVIGNFSSEMLALYRNAGRGLFVDVAPSSSVGQASLLTLAFGCFFFDADLDGALDILVANGHLDAEIERVQPQVRHAEPPLLFWNRGMIEGGRAPRFEEVAKLAGPEFATPRVARGAAHGDLDGDGDSDVVMTVNGGRARVFRNDLPRVESAPHWIALDLRGHQPRDPVGAVVTLVAGGRKQSATCRAGSSYLSQSERTVRFGLGSADRIESLEVKWPSGETSTHVLERIDAITVVQQKP